MKKKQLERLIEAIQNIRGMDGAPGAMGPMGINGSDGIGVSNLYADDSGSLKWWKDTEDVWHRVKILDAEDVPAHPSRIELNSVQLAGEFDAHSWCVAYCGGKLSAFVRLSDIEFKDMLSSKDKTGLYVKKLSCYEPDSEHWIQLVWQEQAFVAPNIPNWQKQIYNRIKKIAHVNDRDSQWKSQYR